MAAANPARGEVSVDAFDERWTLVFDVNAICALEEARGMPFMEAVLTTMPTVAPEDMLDKAKVAAAASKLRFSEVREIFAIGLRRHHPDTTDVLAGDIMQEIGVPAATGIVGKLLTASLGGGGDDEQKPRPPRRPRRGTAG